MILKALKLFLLIAIIALVAYVINQNPQKISLNYGPGDSLNDYSTGLVLLAVFMLGVLFTSLIAAYFGVKSFFKERKYKKEVRNSQQFFEGVLNARALSASGSWDKSLSLWKKIDKQDPTKTIAKVEIAKSLEGSGQIKEALKVLEEARTINPNNPEVLFTAADLNLKLNNQTAAIDNLSLLLYHNPSAKAAELARDLSKELNRTEDAIEYHKRFKELGGEDKDNLVQADLSLLKLQESNLEDENEKAKELKKLVKKFPNHSPLLNELANIEISRDKLPAAADLIIKSAKLTKDFSGWKKLISMWVEKDQPDKALASAKISIKNLEEEDKILSEIELTKIYSKLGMHDDSLELINKIQEDITSLANGSENKDSLEKEVKSLKGLTMNNLGQYKEAGELWKEISKF